MSATAARVARRFVESQGYVAGTVAEARLLGEACDFVLTRGEGLNFSIVCVVDAETEDSRRFELSKQVAKDILAACCHRYCGGGQPAVLVIVEVRRSVEEDDVERLRGYSNRLFDQNAIHAVVLDVSSRKVVTATRYSLLAGLGWRRFLRRELAAQR